MSRLPIPPRNRPAKRDEPTGDQYAEHWARRAKTPHTRARIRRLSKFDDISSGILLIGMGLFVLMILVSIVLGVWFWIAGIDRPEIFFWGFGIAFGVLIFGAIMEMIASDRLDKAKWADADNAIGVIDDVTSRQEKDGEGDTVTVYHVALTAQISDQVTLRRCLEGRESENGGPDGTWIGRRVCFRHNTLDPGDLHDARFAGWPDEKARRS